MTVLVGIGPSLFEIGFREFGPCRSRDPETAADEIVALVPGMPSRAIIRHLQDPPAGMLRNKGSAVIPLPIPATAKAWPRGNPVVFTSSEIAGMVLLPFDDLLRVSLPRLWPAIAPTPPRPRAAN